jgi:hypothetical protein
MAVVEAQAGWFMQPATEFQTLQSAFQLEEVVRVKLEGHPVGHKVPDLQVLTPHFCVAQTDSLPKVAAQGATLGVKVGLEAEVATTRTAVGLQVRRLLDKNHKA